MKCRHRRKRRVWLNSGYVGAHGVHLVEKLACIDCGRQLAMGESNDAGDNVRTEIEAARIAEIAKAQDGAHEMTETEKSGYTAFVFDMNYRGLVLWDVEAFRAGWLAAAIVVEVYP